MTIDLIFRVAAVGILVSVLNQILIRSGRDETAIVTTIGGLILVLMMIVPEIFKFFQTVKTMFQF